MNVKFKEMSGKIYTNENVAGKYGLITEMRVS